MLAAAISALEFRRMFWSCAIFITATPLMSIPLSPSKSLTILATKPDVPHPFRNLLLEEEDRATLRLALLLHDVGKGTLPGDHVKGSLQAAVDVFDRLSSRPLTAKSSIS